MANWRIWCGCLGAVFWLASTAWLARTVRDVVQETVNLTLADGTSISGTLYQPASGSTELPMVVLVHGTAASHRSCAPGLARTLARYDYLTLAVDLRGHGASGGSLPRAELDALTASFEGQSAHPEVEAALDFLKRHPRAMTHHSLAGRPHPLAPGRYPPQHFHGIALVGHSRGGWAATCTARRRDDVDGVVSIGAAPLGVDALRPRNLLFLTGELDCLCPMECCQHALAQVQVCTPPGCVDRMRWLAADAAGEPIDRYGEFWTGSGRRAMRVIGAGHLSEMTNPDIVRCAVEWVNSAMCLEGRSVDSDVYWLLFAVQVATSCGLLVALCLAGNVCQRLLPAVAAGSAASRPWRALLLLAVLAPAMPLIAWFSQWVEVGPAYGTGPTLLLFTAVAGVCLACAGRKQPTEGVPAVCWATQCRGAVVGLLVFGLVLLLLGIPWNLTWMELVPTSRRFVLALVVFPLFLVPSLLLAAGVQQLAGGLVWLAGAIFWPALTFTVWQAIDYLVVPGRPLFLVPGSLLALSFVVSWPLWCVAHRGGLTVARGVAQAAGLAWLLACHLPFVHG